MKHTLVPLLSLLLFTGVALAQDELMADSLQVDSVAALLPAPVTNVRAFDTDDDHGHSITLEWELSADDGAGKESVLSYEVFRWTPYLMDSLGTNRGLRDSLKALADSTDDNSLESRIETVEAYLESGYDRLSAAYTAYPEGGEWRKVGGKASGETTITNAGAKEKESPDYIPDYTDLYYRVDAVTVDTDIRSKSNIVGPVQSSGQWFNGGRAVVLVSVLIFAFLVILFVWLAKRGSDLYVRPLAGIEAVDDAIGRATEMGKPILYVLGLGVASDIATIASFTILGRVAKRVAEYQTELLVPTADPIVMSVAQEVVKSAYMDAGRMDDYKEDSVHFVTQLQFAYVAAVNGQMLRQLPATNIYMGKFFAESLLLAETGALAGSIQIAGTDEIAQIPFFIVACDYTLIGEELYAASAYLGREAILLGSLKAQDYAKAAVIVLAFAGLLCANLGWSWFTDLFIVTN
ncbi:MAG: DUF6754 domain-containing protein [Candidatus Zixiibacteriota bacterium]